MSKEPVPAAQTPAVDVAELEREFSEMLNRTSINPFPEGPFPEAKERELIELTLELANATDEYDEARVIDKLRRLYNSGLGIRDESESDEAWEMRQPGAIKARIRGQLHLIARERAHDGLRSADSVREELRTAAPRLAVLTGFSLNADGDFVHVTQFFGTDLSTLVDYALCLILSRHRPYYAELRQCQLEECGRFFLSSRVGKGKGKPARKFCPGRGCKGRYHSRKTGADRMRRSRAKPSPGKSERKPNARKAK